MRTVKKEEKRKYKKAISSKNPEAEEIKALYNYKVARNNCMQIINDEHEAKSVERLIQTSKSQRANSKPFWNIVRKHMQNNLEDLRVIKTKEGKNYSMN